MLISSRYTGFPARVFYIFSAVWLGILWFFLMASFFSWFFVSLARIFGIASNTRILAGLFFIFAAAISFYGVLNARNTKITRVEVSLPNLPIEWRGKTAVWVSDLHLGHVWNSGTSNRVASTIKNLNPDIVFVGGDFFDGAAIGDLDHLVEPFSRLKPANGIYFITGNHEEFSDPSRYLDAVKKAGIRLLNNESVDINGVKIIGVDYRDASNKENFKKILGQFNIDAEKPSILLKHAPFNIDIAEKAGVSLMLSGHTHRGQMIPFNIITYFVYGGFDYGLKKFGNLIVNTSDGVGTWGPPIRVGTISEIVLITFR